jgi:primosomal protein N' (replication factor Y)
MVGVIDADLGLIGGDMRAVERTYNLLEQVSGRAGRSKKVGKVFIQTYYPDNPVIKSFKNRERKSFIKQTLEERKQFNIPPFGFMTAIIISGPSKSQTQVYANNLIKSSTLIKGIDILGPVEAPLFLLRGRYRYRILLKGTKRSILNNFTRHMIEKTPPSSNLRLTVDVDPYTFM